MQQSMSRNTLVDTPFHYIVSDFNSQRRLGITVLLFRRRPICSSFTYLQPQTNTTIVAIVLCMSFGAGTLLGVEFSLA